LGSGFRPPNSHLLFSSFRSLFRCSMILREGFLPRLGVLAPPFPGALNPCHRSRCGSVRRRPSSGCWALPDGSSGPNRGDPNLTRPPMPLLCGGSWWSTTKKAFPRQSKCLRQRSPLSSLGHGSKSSSACTCGHILRFQRPPVNGIHRYPNCARSHSRKEM